MAANDDYLQLSGLFHLLFLFAIATVIFCGLGRSDRIYEPPRWLGGCLFVIGATGLGPSIVALTKQENVVAGWLVPIRLHPIQALIGYLGCLVGGLLMLFSRKTMKK